MLDIKNILEIEIKRNFLCLDVKISYDRGGHWNYMDADFKYIQKDGKNIGSMSTYLRLDKNLGSEFQRLFNELKKNNLHTERLTIEFRRNEVLEELI